MPTITRLITKVHLGNIAKRSLLAYGKRIVSFKQIRTDMADLLLLTT